MITQQKPGVLAQFLTVQEIARSLNLDSDTVRGYIRKGEIKAKKMGRDYRVHPQDYEAFLSSH